MKKLVVIFFLSAVVLASGSILRETGIAGRTGSPGETTCVACHSDFALNTGGGSISISNTGMTNWAYVPGQTYQITVTVSKSGFNLFGCGIECLTAAGTNAGSFAIINSSTQLKNATINNVSRSNVVHTLNGGVSANSKAFIFNWTAPPAGTGTVTFYFTGNAANADGGTGGDYIYSGSRTVTETSCTPPAAIPSIAGPSEICAGTSVTYSVNPVANATTYSWSLPSGWSGSSTTNSITVTTGTTSGNVSVTASNACASTSRSLGVNVFSSVPGIPGTISGSNYNNCGVSTKTYSVSAVPNASSYTWRTDIPGATINGSSSPVNTTSASVSLTFPSNFSPGFIYVKAVNACGAGAERSKKLYATPKVPSVISGPLAPCLNTSNLNYSISPVTGASSYSWVVPSTFMNLVSGQGTNSVNLSTKSVAGICTLKVGSVNACGTSTRRSLAVNIVSCQREFTLSGRDIEFIGDLPRKVELYGIDGKLVRTVHNPEMRISFSDQPGGIYLLKLYFEEKVAGERIFLSGN